MRNGWLIALLMVGACAADREVVDDDDFLDGKADGASTVNVKSTALDVDLESMTAVATIDLERNGNVALEVGGLTVTRVTDNRGNRQFRVRNGKLRVTSVYSPLVVTYGFTGQDQANGLLPGGSTVIWPYHCGNVFPCHSEPADGTTFELNLDGVPAGKTAVYPEAIEAEAPPYMLAWAVGDYEKAALGTTAAGTKIGVHWLPGGETDARAGTKNLVKVVDWFETNIGPYAFGDRIESVSVVWGEGLYGGMEHHPYFHVAKDAMSDQVTQAHEAAHGWFGDGVRIKCWEDFVLSEGTVSYLSARALAQVSPQMEAQIWADYQDELDAAIAEGGAPAWPTGCNQIDIIEDKLFTNLPYMQGAFFYKDVADVVGADVLDGVISRFYNKYKNKPARMQDMIDAIKTDTGFNPSVIVEERLRKQF
jgi:aminopeptidase N